VSVQTKPPRSATVSAEPRPPQAYRQVLRQVLRPLASLRLTVWLLALSIVLVFAGTWAQIDMGIWNTLDTYFRAFFVVIPFQIFLPRDWNVPGGLPFPGGFVIGTLLMVNLIAAHAVRFKLAWKRSGILMIHFGLILLLAGELVTAMFAVEERMSIDEGETVDFAEDTRQIELAIVDMTDPEHDRVVAVPQAHLQHRGRVRHAGLPFEIQVEEFFHNAELVQLPEGHSPIRTATHGLAAEMRFGAVERSQASGVDQDDMDLPAAYVTLFDGERPLGTWLVALYFSLLENPDPQIVELDGRKYRLALRYKRTYKPYSIHLVDFRHDRYLGTDTPRNYSSQIRLVDTAHNEDREVLIYMNNPLRYRGETFYQASFKQGDTGTVLQVVRNPGWLLPYVACIIGALGMMVQFGMHLTRFIARGRWA
jgi:hypothetical protein